MYMYTTAFFCPHLLHSRYVSTPSQFQCLCKPYTCILFSFVPTQVFSILFVLKVPSRTADIKPDRDEQVAQEGGVVYTCAHVHVHIQYASKRSSHKRAVQRAPVPIKRGGNGARTGAAVQLPVRTGTCIG